MFLMKQQKFCRTRMMQVYIYIYVYICVEFLAGLGVGPELITPLGFMTFFPPWFTIYLHSFVECPFSFRVIHIIPLRTFPVWLMVSFCVGWWGTQIMEYHPWAQGIGHTIVTRIWQRCSIIDTKCTGFSLTRCLEANCSGGLPRSFGELNDQCSLAVSMLCLWGTASSGRWALFRKPGSDDCRAWKDVQQDKRATPSCCG